MPGQMNELKTAQLLQELHQRGVTYQKVANNLGVTWRTVHRCNQRRIGSDAGGRIG